LETPIPVTIASVQFSKKPKWERKQPYHLIRQRNRVRRLETSIPVAIAAVQFPKEPKWEREDEQLASKLR
jgi:hypothetical protein